MNGYKRNSFYFYKYNQIIIDISMFKLYSPILLKICNYKSIYLEMSSKPSVVYYYDPSQMTQESNQENEEKINESYL